MEWGWGLNIACGPPVDAHGYDCQKPTKVDCTGECKWAINGKKKGNPAGFAHFDQLTEDKVKTEKKQ